MADGTVGFTFFFWFFFKYIDVAHAICGFKKAVLGNGGIIIVIYFSSLPISTLVYASVMS